MMKITGLDKLTRELDDAQKALAELGTELGIVKFNPNDPASIEAAIHEMESTIDGRVGAYATNSIIGPLAEQMKETYRREIIDRAAVARLESPGDE